MSDFGDNMSSVTYEIISCATNNHQLCEDEQCLEVLFPISEQQEMVTSMIYLVYRTVLFNICYIKI